MDKKTLLELIRNYNKEETGSNKKLISFLYASKLISKT